MPVEKKFCCGTKRRVAQNEEMDLPEKIREELEQLGGFDALAKSIPPREELIEKSKTYHALQSVATYYPFSDQRPAALRLRHQPVHVSCRSKLSYHLTILKESGLIEGEYHGNWIIYSITEHGLKAVAS